MNVSSPQTHHVDRAAGQEGERQGNPPELPQLDQVLDVLVEIDRGLHVSRSGVMSALRTHPHANHVAAAHAVCAWVSDPAFRNRNAAALLLRALPNYDTSPPPSTLADPPPSADGEAWAPIAVALEERDSFRYEIWFSRLELVGDTTPTPPAHPPPAVGGLTFRRGTSGPGAQRVLVIRAPEHVRTWVRERYAGLIAEVASEVLGHRVAVEIVGIEWRPQAEPPA